MKKEKNILCGKIGRPFGVKGELTVFWNNVEAPLKNGEHVFLDERSKHAQKTLTLTSSRVQADRSIVRFAEVHNREDAAALTNQELFIPESKLAKLPHNEYYTYQLLGLQVYDDAGVHLGELVNIFPTGSNDVYEVLPPGKKTGEELCIPALQNVIQKIDLASKCMTIKVLPGLLSDEVTDEI